jgi:hypothetical protein
LDKTPVRDIFFKETNMDENDIQLKLNFLVDTSDKLTLLAVVNFRLKTYKHLLLKAFRRFYQKV